MSILPPPIGAIFWKVNACMHHICLSIKGRHIGCEEVRYEFAIVRAASSISAAIGAADTNAPLLRLQKTVLQEHKQCVCTWISI